MPGSQIRNKVRQNTPPPFRKPAFSRRRPVTIALFPPLRQVWRDVSQSFPDTRFSSWLSKPLESIYIYIVSCSRAGSIEVSLSPVPFVAWVAVAVSSRVPNRLSLPLLWSSLPSSLAAFRGLSKSWSVCRLLGFSHCLHRTLFKAKKNPNKGKKMQPYRLISNNIKAGKKVTFFSYFLEPKSSEEQRLPQWEEMDAFFLSFFLHK